MSDAYGLRVSGAARRALEHELPLPVALAVWEFCTGPRRVGKPLGRELTGYYSARRGAYRVIYQFIEENTVIHIVRIEHQADVYRRR